MQPFEKPSDRLIPLGITAFFGLLMVIMAWFVWFAMRDYPGEITRDAYEKGLHYNRSLQKSAEQAMLGWDAEAHIHWHELVTSIDFSLHDKNAKAIPDAVVQAGFIRPTHAGQDVYLILTPDGQGGYNGSTTLPWQGEWEVHISATSQGHNYQMVKNINIQ